MGSRIGVGDLGPRAGGLALSAEKSDRTTLGGSPGLTSPAC